MCSDFGSVGRVQSVFSSHIEGTTGDVEIANKFVDYYKALSGPPIGAL